MQHVNFVIPTKFSSPSSTGIVLGELEKTCSSVKESFSGLPATGGRQFLLGFGTEARREWKNFELQIHSVTKGMKHKINGTNELTLIQLSIKII